MRDVRSEVCINLIHEPFVFHPFNNAIWNAPHGKRKVKAQFSNYVVSLLASARNCIGSTDSQQAKVNDARILRSVNHFCTHLILIPSYRSRRFLLLPVLLETFSSPEL